MSCRVVKQLDVKLSSRELDYFVMGRHIRPNARSQSNSLDVTEFSLFVTSSSGRFIESEKF